MRRAVVAIAFALLPLAAPAQDAQSEDDKGYLTTFLENNLSDAGREVRIDGFQGALSSRATFRSLTIADDTGVWITIRDGAIGWNRKALLSGRIEIAEMSAAEIDLPRLPGQPRGGLPDVEARGFSLPDLPVSISIGELRADRVVLGAPILGESVALDVGGAIRLAGGEGTADLAIRRLDGTRGSLTLKAGYANATRQLDLDLLVDEGQGGIAARLIGLPGQPSVTLALHGSDPINDFRADVALSTDSQPRLTGTVRLAAVPAGDAAASAQRLEASLGGDISPLLQPEYQTFFGKDVRLTVAGERRPSGELALDDLTIASQALRLKGSAELSADGLPQTLDLTLAMGLADGSPVLLPLPGDPTRVRDARLRLTYDAAKGEDWHLTGRLNRLGRPGLMVAALDLSGEGTISRGAGTPTADGTLALTATGIAPADPALAQAIGPDIGLDTTFQWAEGAPLRLSQFAAQGAGVSLEGAGLLRGLDSGFTFEGAIRAVVADMARFSAMAGRNLGGSGEVQISGSYGLLSGEADVDLDIAGQDLRLSQPEADRLLQGTSRVTASVRRSTEGTQIKALSVTARTLAATASGWLRAGATQLKAALDFSDLSVLGPGYGGTLAAEAVLDEAEGRQHLLLTGKGQSLRSGIGALDPLLAGQTELSLAVTGTDGVILLDSLDLKNPQFEAHASGQSDNAGDRIELTARLADLAILVPGFPGAAHIEGQAVRDGARWAVDATASGPGGTDARVTGSVGTDGIADLAIAGSAQAGLANAFIAPRSIEGPAEFDLRLAGRPSLNALSGRLRLPGLRISDPSLAMAVEGAEVTVDLAGGRADLSGEGSLAGGGTVSLSGPVGLTAPYTADLSVRLDAVRLRDPRLFDTRADGTLTIGGPLAGGAAISGSVTLAETEIRVPTSGLGGYADIGPVNHIAEPAEVRATRERAGLLGGPGERAASLRRPYALDIAVAAPRRVFVRGRGLDAELGGSLRLTGTTDNVIPVGQFDLIRGRLHLLGKRFDIDEGQVVLQGALVPWIRFAANSTSDGITATILIEGPAAEPDISFTSSPPLPQDEIVAQLLFGRGIETLSVFQAAQLASAIATLTGRGGEGIVSRLRRSFGLDDLDVETGADGGFALRAGKYLTSNLYTDVTLDEDGQTEINLNFDVRKNVTMRGRVASDGETGIGIYYERDY